MTETWERWVGHTVDEQFCLRQYLGGSDHSAVFSTEYNGPEPRAAVIKLVPINREEAKLHLSRAESAARLSHPRLLQVFHVGLCQFGEMCLLYTVMEQAEEDLSQVIPQRALSAAEAREILIPALDALAYVHGQGFVHGHLKPSNFLASDNRVKISGDSLYRTGDGGISPANDVWLLAMTLVEGLTQRREWPVTLPAPFQEIAQHCLQQNPRRRWTLAQISQLLNPVAAQRQEPRSRWLNYALPVLALIVLAILAGPKLLSKRAAQPTVQSPPVTIASLEPSKPVAAPAVYRPAQPVKAPVPDAPVPDAPVPDAPVRDAPVRDASVRDAPVRDASVRDAPVRDAPVRDAPARDAPARDTPARDASPIGIVHQVLPAVPGKASSTIHGRVKIGLKLNVDPTGSVSDAELDPPVSSRYFGDLALQAARDWKFEPSRVDGQEVPSKWMLRFEFQPTQTKVYPERISP